MGYSAVSDFLFRKLIAKSLLVLFTSQILFPLFTLSEVFAADTTPPIITLSGASSIITPVGSVFTDPGATCIDDLDPSCNVIASGSVDTSMTGTYTITYDATDLAGNTATQLQRDVTVIDAPDTIPPTATVLYSTTGATNSGVIATLTGYSESITILSSSGSNTYLFTTNGSFTFTYQDGAGNTGSTTATVTNIDTTPPVITLLGSPIITIAKGGSFIDPGTICNDNFDSTCSVTITGSVNTNFIGSYILSYIAHDIAGNRAILKTRNINVIEPIISGPGGGGGGGGGSSFSNLPYISFPPIVLISDSGSIDLSPIVPPNTISKLHNPKLARQSDLLRNIIFKNKLRLKKIYNVHRF